MKTIAKGGAVRIVAGGQEHIFRCAMELDVPPPEMVEWFDPQVNKNLTATGITPRPCLRLTGCPQLPVLVGEQAVAVQAVFDARLPASDNPEIRAEAEAVRQTAGEVDLMLKGPIERTAPPAWAYAEPEFAETVAAQRWMERLPPA